MALIGAAACQSEKTNESDEEAVQIDKEDSFVADENGDVPKEPDKSEETSTETYSYIGDGEDGVITTDGFVAATEDDLEQIIDYANANNYDAITRMELRGQIFPVDKGTEITVVDRGFLKAEIEIIDTGQRGFVPVEMIGK